MLIIDPFTQFMQLGLFALLGFGLGCAFTTYRLTSKRRCRLRSGAGLEEHLIDLACTEHETGKQTR